MSLVTLLRAEDLFDSLKTEEGQPTRIPEVKPNSTLEAIVRKFERLLNQRSYVDPYHKSVFLLSPRFKEKVSADDVEQFSLLLARYQDHSSFFSRTGSFISALVNTSPDAEFRVHTRSLEPFYLSHLGHANVKQLRIIGNAGSDLGEYMTKGKIVVEGNAMASLADHLRGGEIEVEGDIVMSEKHEGFPLFMLGGTIRIQGNVDAIIRAPFIGEMHIAGDYHSMQISRISEIKEAECRIYHKGKLLVKGITVYGGRHVE